MGIDLLGPVRLFVIFILFVALFGPGIWFINKIMEKTGADTNKQSITIWTLLLGVALTFIIALIGRGQGWWGE